MEYPVILLALTPVTVALILVLIFLFFGASALPKLARALGESKRALKEGLSGKEVPKE